jgi:hypothetical protein
LQEEILVPSYCPPSYRSVFWEISRHFPVRRKITVNKKNQKGKGEKYTEKEKTEKHGDGSESTDTVIVSWGK